MDTTSPAASSTYRQVQESEDFKDLRRRFRGFVFPCTIFFLVWYFAYVILADYFPEFMSIKVFANINVGLILGLLQFVTTFGITIAYVRWADRVFDPRAEAIRDRLAGQDLTGTGSATHVADTHDADLRRDADLRDDADLRRDGAHVDDVRRDDTYRTDTTGTGDLR